MKHVIRILEILFNPFYTIITANESNKSRDKFSFFKNKLVLLFISLLITLFILGLIYHKELFGV